MNTKRFGTLHQLSDPDDALARPTFVRGDIFSAFYDGETDDLLTGGLGRDGLAALGQLGTAERMQHLQTFEDPLRPTREELRRSAIWNAHTELIDLSPAAGYGRLYGPGVIDGVLVGDGRVAGHEYIAYAAAPGGNEEDVITLMVQIPASFDPDDPWLVAAATSGSRGIYGAVPTVGEWALQHHCAIAYTDKGTGIGLHDLENDIAYRIDGTYASAEMLGEQAHFRARMSAEERAAFGLVLPHRVACKHAHSQINPERYWGTHVHLAIAFGLFVLNRHFGADPAMPHFSRGSTRILVAGVSNGGGAALRAAELDADDMIDAVVVSEPQVQPIFTRSFVICQEGRPPVVEHSRPILDTMTLLNLFQACASCLDGLPKPAAGSEERCRRLAGWGLLEPSEDIADEIQSLARSARAILEEHGLLPEQHLVQVLSHALGVPLGVSVTFANAYGRFHVTDNLAGYGFAATDAKGVPMPMTARALASLFAIGRGIPPMPGVNIINSRIGLVDPISTPDQNLEGALTLRSLYTGADLITGELLAGEALERHRRLRIGIATTTATALLRGIPTILVHGRSDEVVAPNHSSRAYYGRNQVVEGEAGHVRYYEVTNAHHFDAFNSSPLFAEYQLADHYVPLHPYFLQALTMMKRHLTEGAAYPLPPSQVVPTLTRAAGGPDLPPIASDPGANRILFRDGRLFIPSGARQAS